MQGWIISVLWALAPLILWRLCALIHHYILMPQAVKHRLKQQSITGPPAYPVVGNLSQILKMREMETKNGFSDLTHDILAHVLPDYTLFSRKYGKLYLTWWGDEPRLNIDDPEIIRKVLCSKGGHFGRTPLMQKYMSDLPGISLLAANGEDWAQRRRIVSPAFSSENIKAFVETIAKCASDMVQGWQLIVNKQGSEAEIEVFESLNCLAADMISHTAFGSDYQSGRRVFQLIRLIVQVLPEVNKLVWLPCNRLLPTQSNWKLRKLKNELDLLLENMVQARRASGDMGNDLLGAMLAEVESGKKSKGSFDNKKLIEECKTFYFAGSETVSAMLGWCLMLLAKYPHWQDLARKEVQSVCNNVLDCEMLNRLKMITMILNESLRLYPPAVLLQRGNFKDMDTESVFIPKGVGANVPVLAIHHDPALWGADVNDFNPARFRDGILAACKHPMAFIPFGAGPRICVGQTLAVMEAKITLILILKHFKFRLSPNYCHNPIVKGNLRPNHGIPIIFQNL